MAPPETPQAIRVDDFEAFDVFADQEDAASAQRLLTEINPAILEGLPLEDPDPKRRAQAIKTLRGRPLDGEYKFGEKEFYGLISLSEVSHQKDLANIVRH